MSRRWPTAFDVVVGNPPFLGQLASATALPREQAAVVRRRTGGLVSGYADPAAAFLAIGVGAARAGGRVAMLQPLSFLASRDTAPLRAALSRSCALTGLWISGDRVFEGTSARACAPVLVRGGDAAREVAISAGAPARMVGTARVDPSELMRAGAWSALVSAVMEPGARGSGGARGQGKEASGVIGDVARATADFRDEYYALRGLIVEGDGGADPPRVMTSGLIDAARSLWGVRPARVHGRSWTRPCVASASAPEAVGAWLARRLVPKVLVATQTRAIEAVADDAGTMAPLTPVISVMPGSGASVWLVASGLCSPVCAEWAFSRSYGLGLSAGAIRLRARDLLEMPLPSDESAWEEAAARFRGAQEAEAVEQWRMELGRFGRAMLGAHGVARSRRRVLWAWWWPRVSRGGRGVAGPAAAG